jgi:hypothetical protein
MSLLSSLYTSYSITPVVSDGLEIIYSYSQKDPVVSYIDISYNYSDPSDTSYVDLVYGRKVSYTQQILNNFPQWMEMRKNYDSNGNLLVNSWGQNLEHVLDTYSFFIKEQFLSTANSYNDLHIGVSELLGKGRRVYEPKLDNILYNSSFSMQAPGRFKKPSGWGVKRDNIYCIEYDKNNSVFGNYGILLKGSIGKSQLSQNRPVQAQSGPLTYTIYVKTPNDNGLATDELYEANEAGIILSILYADSSIETFGIGFPKNTEGSWARASFTVNLSKETNSIDAHIVNRVAIDYVIDCPMLSFSDAATEWTASINDMPISSKTIFRSVSGVQVIFDSLDSETVKKIEVIPVGSEEEFRYQNLPTRIEQAIINSNTSNFYTSIYSRHVNAFEEVMPCQWTAVNGSIQEKSATTPDIFSSRKPADIFLKHDGNLVLDKSLIDSSSVSVKAVCVVDDILYVVTEETYAGLTKYYLKFVKPHVISYTDIYMPSIGDIEIPIQLGTEFGPGALSETITRIGICKSLPNHIFIDTSLDRRFYYKLYYDYCYADYNSRRVYCRENYSKENGRLQII